MTSELATQLKEILDNMSQEDFDRVWSEIVALELNTDGLDGENVGGENEEKNIPESLDNSSEDCTIAVQ